MIPPAGTPDTAVHPVRVLVMIDTLLAGGAERLAVELACALDRSRFAPHVLVTRHSGPLEALLQRADVPYTVLGRTRRLQVLPWLRAYRLARRCDVVHAHKFGSNVWGALLARAARVPLIAHEHNFSAEASRSRRLLDRRWIAPAAERVVCVSQSVADVERALGVPDRKITVIPNGVRIEAAWPRASARDELGLAQDEFVIGIVGRLRPEKAHDVLLGAMAQLLRSGRNARLCVVGDGPCADQLHAQARTLGISEHVSWAGERADAARLAAAFDVGVVCSHWEGLPLAALESMAAGVPLVASAVGGLPELLADGAGLLVPPGNPAELATAIASCQDDLVQTRAMAANGERRVREQHSFRRMVSRIEQLYVSVLAERSAVGQLLADTAHDTPQRGEAA